MSLQQPDVTKLNVPLKYRVQSPDGNVYPTSNRLNIEMALSFEELCLSLLYPCSCLIWVGPSGSNDEGYWDSSLCKLSRVSSLILQLQYIALKKN